MGGVPRLTPVPVLQPKHSASDSLGFSAEVTKLREMFPGHPVELISRIFQVSPWPCTIIKMFLFWQHLHPPSYVYTVCFIISHHSDSHSTVFIFFILLPFPICQRYFLWPPKDLGVDDYFLFFRISSNSSHHHTKKREPFETENVALMFLIPENPWLSPRSCTLVSPRIFNF